MTPDQAPLRLLILGAAYGILPATRLALAGHAVTLVGRPAEVAAIAARGTCLRLPAKEGPMLELRAGGAATAPLAAVTPEAAAPEEADLVLLAMGEPQYRAPEVAALVTRIAAAQRPCLSIMNMPPPPFLARLGIPAPAEAYASGAVWAGLDPALVTLASPDAQAVRPDPSRPELLQVTLATNFKVAPFAQPQHQALLARIARDGDALRVEQGGALLTPQVRFVAAESRFVPLAKWPMLIAGNCRCPVPGAPPRPIRDAVWDDPEAARRIYDRVLALALALGAPAADLVPFDRYAAAARGLTLPSSFARALHGGAPAVERVDLLIARLAADRGLGDPAFDAIVAATETQLAANGAAA